jgi:hypothetical protein
MKHLLKKLSFSSLEVVGYAQVGDQVFNIAKKGSAIKGFLNGCEVYSILESDPRVKESSIVFSSIINHMFKNSGEKNIKLYRSEWKSSKESSSNLLEEILPGLTDNAEGKCIVIVKNKPEDVRDIKMNQSPGFSADNCIPLDSLSKNLNVFKRKVNSYYTEFEDALKVAETFTRRKLKGSMWGAKDMQKILDKSNSEILGNYWKQADVSVEVLEKSIDRLTNKFSNVLLKDCPEEKKMVAAILIPNVIKSYSDIKEAGIKLATLLSQLVSIDKTFSEKTSYPARFFIPEEIMVHANDSFGSVIDFLCMSPAIESKVLDPLDFVRLQMLAV